MVGLLFDDHDDVFGYVLVGEPMLRHERLSTNFSGLGLVGI